MEHLCQKISALTFYTTISVTMLFQSKTNHSSKLSQSEYSAHLLPKNIFKTTVTSGSRCVSLSMFHRPCLQVFGRFRLSLSASLIQRPLHECLAVPNSLHLADSRMQQNTEKWSFPVTLKPLRQEKTQRACPTK